MTRDLRTVGVGLMVVAVGLVLLLGLFLALKGGVGRNTGRIDRLENKPAPVVSVPAPSVTVVIMPATTAPIVAPATTSTPTTRPPTVRTTVPPAPSSTVTTSTTAATTTTSTTATPTTTTTTRLLPCVLNCPKGSSR